MSTDFIILVFLLDLIISPILLLIAHNATLRTGNYFIKVNASTFLTFIPVLMGVYLVISAQAIGIIFFIVSIAIFLIDNFVLKTQEKLKKKFSRYLEAVEKQGAEK